MKLYKGDCQPSIYTQCTYCLYDSLPYRKTQQQKEETHALDCMLSVEGCLHVIGETLWCEGVQ